MTLLRQGEHPELDDEEYEYYSEEDEDHPGKEHGSDDTEQDDDDHQEQKQQKQQQHEEQGMGDDSMSCATYSAIKFADWEEVVEIDCDYTPDETNAMWFNSDDYASFLEQCEAKAAQMVAQGDGSSPIHLRDLIGLEAWTKEGYKKRQRQRLGSIDVVLDEQFAQWDDGEEDAESIAALYTAASEESKLVASTKALHLERDVQAYLESTMESYETIKAISTRSLTSTSIHAESCSSNSSLQSSFRNPADSKSTQVTAVADDEDESVDEADEDEDNDQLSDESNGELLVVVDTKAKVDTANVEEVQQATATRPPKVPVKKSDSQWKKVKGAAPVYNKYQQTIVVPSSIRREAKKGSSKKLEKESSSSSVVSTPITPSKPSSTSSVSSSTPITPTKPSSTSSASSITDSSVSSISYKKNNKNDISRLNSLKTKIIQSKQAEIIDLPTRRAPPKIKSLAGRRKPEALRKAPTPHSSAPVKKIVTKKPLVKKHPPQKHAPMSSLRNNNNNGNTMNCSNHSLKTSQHGSINNLRSSQHMKHPPMKHKPGSQSTGMAGQSCLRQGSNHTSSRSNSSSTPPVVKKKVPKLNTVTVRKPGEGPPKTSNGTPISLKFKRSGPIPVMTPVAKSSSSSSKKKVTVKKSSMKSSKAKTEGGIVPNFLRRKA